jgi:hypothetical protein
MPLKNHRRYFFAGMLPRRSIDLTAVYGNDLEARRLHAAEIAALVQHYRLTAAAA